MLYVIQNGCKFTLTNLFQKRVWLPLIFFLHENIFLSLCSKIGRFKKNSIFFPNYKSCFFSFFNWIYRISLKLAH